MCDCRRKTIQVFAADLHEEVQVQGRPLEAHQALPSWPHAAPDARAVARRRIEERFQRQGSLLVVGCLQQLVDVVGVVIPFFDLHQHLGAPADRQQVLPAAPASTSAETDRVVRIPGQAAEATITSATATATTDGKVFLNATGEDGRLIPVIASTNLQGAKTFTVAKTHVGTQDHPDRQVVVDQAALQATGGAAPREEALHVDADQVRRPEIDSDQVFGPQR